MPNFWFFLRKLSNLKQLLIFYKFTAKFCSRCICVTYMERKSLQMSISLCLRNGNFTPYSAPREGNGSFAIDFSGIRPMDCRKHSLKPKSVVHLQRLFASSIIWLYCWQTQPTSNFYLSVKEDASINVYSEITHIWQCPILAECSKASSHVLRSIFPPHFY